MRQKDHDINIILCDFVYNGVWYFIDFVSFHDSNWIDQMYMGKWL